MKISVAILMITLFSVSARCQVNKSIRGIVKDYQNAPLAGATTRLLYAKDSAIISTKITNDNGRFEFTGLANGDYCLVITSMGYKKYNTSSFTISDNFAFITVPAIILAPEKDLTLKEVTVTAKRPLILQEIDKTVVNIDAMISAAGGNTLEVLEKTPGVAVTSNGEISLNGKAGVLVLIDGRATYMSGQDLAAYLKSLPASVLDKLELMDNPPSKYDAAGNAIINIKLKRNKTAGTTGSIGAAYSQGVYARNNESINLSYNKKKMNLYGNFSHNNEIGYSDDLYNRKFYTASNLLQSSVSLANFQKSSSRNYNARLGVDYLPSPNTTYGVIINVNTGPREGLLQYNSSSYNSSHQPDSNGKGINSTAGKRTNLEANLNYLHRFNNKGREISADLNYLNYQSNENQALQNLGQLADGSITNDNKFLYQLPGNITICTFKTDYTHPLQNNSSWEAGVKSSIVTNDNDSRYFSVTGNVTKPDDSRSNYFIYHENINAAYLNTRKSWKRLGVQFGVRVEHTNITGNQLGNGTIAGSSFRKDYSNVFPTGFLSYKLDSLGNNSFSGSLARRINRPNYQYLNPFLFFRDNYSYSGGNPMLNPQFQFQYQLKYQHKQLLGLSLQYGHFTDVIFQTTQAVGNIFITRPENVQSGYMLILATNLSLDPTKWWSMNYNLMLAHMALNGTVYTEKLHPSTNVFRLSLLNQFTISKTWSAELSGNYGTRDIAGQRIIKARYRFSVAAQKKFWKDKASLKIVMDDILHLAIQRDYSINIRQAESYHINETDTQRIGLAFTYRFGKDTFAKKTKHVDNAADAEKGRIE